jgi:hypothetical protein
MSQEQYKLFSKVPLESLEMFAEALGTQNSEVYQQYLQLTKNNRSALKRLIKRKGTSGFSEDVPRVLASFVTSNARMASNSMNLPAANKAVRDIKDGDVQDEAVKLVDAVQNPQETAGAWRGLLFMNFIGGSAASALVNMTQPITMTLPYLSQWGGIVKATSRLTKAMAATSSGKVSDPVLRGALKRAEAAGIVSPQEIHHLTAEAMGTFGNNPVLKKVAFVWGSMFSLAEQFNRRVSFIAAYETARDEGIADPFEFAKKSVQETQGIYCVDAETECLTVAGWKRHDKLQIGEAIYALNDDCELVESRLLEVHVHDHAKVLRFRNSNGFSMVLTPEHDCLVQSFDDRVKRWYPPKKVKASALKHHQVLRVPLGDATGREEVLTDDQVRLVAWVAAEGHLFTHRNCVGARGVGLVQSLTHNPVYVEEIDDLLQRLGGHFNRKVSKVRERGGQMVCWQLRKPLWSWLHKVLPGKMLTPELVKSLTVQQMRLFLETFVKGDGHIPEEGGPTIAQKDRSNMDCLQAMAVLSGTSSSLQKKVNHDWYSLYLAKNSKRAYAKELTVEEGIEPMVWCPETEHGTWIARRNGRTFVTGNSKGNAANWARNPVGAAALAFKQFSVHYLEWLVRMWKSGPEGKKAVGYALALLMLAAGAEGLPFAEDLNDMLDTLAQAMGYDWSSRQAKHEFIANTLGLGDDAATVMTRGLSTLAGVPFDTSIRMSSGNLLPGTGMFLRSNTDRSRDVMEFAGAAGGLAKQFIDAGDHALEGNFKEAAKGVVPIALQNMMKGAEMFGTGEFRDTKGRKVMEATEVDAFMKTIGFTPSKNAAESRAMGEVMRSVQLVKNVEGDIVSDWAKGMRDQDPDAVKSAVARLQQWNADNPRSPIQISPAQVRRRVQELGRSRAERTIKAAPKELRPAVAAAMQGG